MNYLTHLNTEQNKAVNTVEGPLLVLAGAGSGKTRVVTYRIAKLLDIGVNPAKILGLTFTNKAANEMKERIKTLTQSNVLISTFHSLGARILRESIHHLGYKNDFTIYDEEDVIKLLKACLKELDLVDKKMDPKAFRGLISHAKNDLQSPDHIDESGATTQIEKVFPRVYARYQSHLQNYNAVDFDDLLYLTVKLFSDHSDILEHYQDRWDFLLIDEYQDTNEAQYAMVRMLVSKTNNICVVGDPDQSIYSWRGANIRNILNFENDFPGANVIRLEQNYRSRSNILDAANNLICYNDNRYEKKLWTDLGEGEKIKHYTGNTEQEEARFITEKIRYYHEQHNIPLKEIVVFYRTNFQSRVFEDRLLFSKTPYVIVGGISFYQRREIKDILAFLRMVHSGADYISFARTINIPKRGIGGATIEKVRIGAAQENLSILDFCQALIRGEPLNTAIRLSAKQKQGIQDYLQIIHELTRIHQECSLKELVTAAIEESGYLKALSDDPETFDDRKGNLDELITKAMEWEQDHENPTLATFLEELSLKSSLDEAESTNDRVNLMTIHNGKGLEFTLVFLVGMEEDLFPHANARGSHSALEEERRLCYVGMTRAKEYLYLTNARFRYLWGMGRTQRPSRFFREIPTKFIEKIRSTSRREQKPHVEDEFIDEIDQTYPEEGKAEHFSTGDAVFHDQFGVGVVQEAYQGSIGLSYKILFSKDNQVKNIVAKYAQLTRL
ncbi:MAG: ATP-dependent DNA helicase PcrA [Chlamydiae bacterium]|nr:ATP-dependent DNA helicase PcrA [Chlamydiota bacterium]